MDRRTAKEFLHIHQWLANGLLIVEAGRDAYDRDELLQEAGDSLMMKLGEAARRLSEAGATPPSGLRWADAIANRNWVIHQYDQIDRDITWSTLERDFAEWQAAVMPTFDEATRALGTGT